MLNRLVNFRIAKNITQTQLADAVGVSQQAVSQWENGKKTPKSMYVKRIAMTLGVTSDEILDCVDVK